MVGVRSETWFSRRRRAARAERVPSAWRYGAPTSDSTSGSTSLTASAALTSAGALIKRGTKKQKGADPKADTSWQDEAWEMYDQVGELRYVSNAIAGRMGQADLVVERNGERLTEDAPGFDEVESLLSLITGAMVERMGLNLFVAGGGWLAGLPPEEEPAPGSDGHAAEDIDWCFLSTREVKKSRGSVEIRGRKYAEEDIFLVRVWDSHPSNWEEADSPTRAALPVLRELVGLTQHVSAQIDSRLAGAGVYWVPNSILNSASVPEGADVSTEFAENPVLNAIMTAMLLPMEDRSNASSVVPLLLGAPDDAIAKIRHDTFSTPFDENTKDLREEAIRRLGLCLDAPPELLQGMGDANHWGMWLVRDEVIQAHVAPRLAVVSDALTTGFLRPLLEQILPGSDPADFEVVFDVSHLVQRPNRLADASQLHAAGVVGDDTLREAGGFGDEDAPSSRDRAIAVALEVGRGNPQLLDNMGEIYAAVYALLDGSPETGPEPDEPATPATLPRQPGAAPTPGARPQPSAPNGSPRPRGGAPLAEADGQPRAGSPVA